MSRLVARLGRRYLAVLAAVAALVLIDQAVLQPLLIRLNGVAPVINLAGRQRMLSQKITKTALTIDRLDREHASFQRDRLQQDLADWTRAHRGLQHGDPDLGLPGNPSPAVSTEFAKLQPHFDAMHAAAEHIADARADTSNATRALLDSEASYLPQMDHIVGVLEREAQRQVARLRMLGLSITAAVLTMLVGLGAFVVRPAAATIRGQLDQLDESRWALKQARDELEIRVAERTRQLSETNEALRLEMSERERAEDQARAVQSQLAHVARVHAIGQLATGLAHELNQPLGVIVNSAETAELMIDRDPADLPAAKSGLHRIRDAALRAGHIIRRMRNFLRPAARERTASDLNPLVSEVAELCGPELQAAAVSLKLDLADEPLPLEADPIQIQQVLVNLVQNSAQAMREASTGRASRAGDIIIRTRRDGDGAIVSVEDTGPGFTTDPETACGPFFTTRPDGLGLGLAISRSILHNHGGELRIESEPGRGARIACTLPLVIVSHPQPGFASAAK